MKVDLYEKVWMWAVGVMLTLFFVSTAAAAFGGAVHPPSHVETIDPTRVLADPRFSTRGVSVDEAGRVHARLVGMAFAWLPATLTLPANRPVTFHVTSMDVVHGFEIVRTNGQTMTIPGYVSQFTTQFEPGEYLVVCNEYCGVGHHTMSGKIVAGPAAEWRAPASARPLPPAAIAEAGGEHADH